MTTVEHVPKLRFPGFEENWNRKKLSYFLEFKNGLNAEKCAYGKGYKFINVLDIIENTYITHESIIGSVDVTSDVFKKYIVEYGDIVFQRSSETREEVGQANVYLDKERPATFGGFVIRGKKIRDYSPIFINNLLKTTKARKKITSMSGGSTRYNIGQESLKDVIIYVPVIIEQQKIATFLSSVDAKIEALKKKKDLLEMYKKGMMQKLFNQEIRFKDDDGNEYPCWEEMRLGDVLDYLQPTMYLVKSTEYSDNYSIPVLTAGKTFVLGYTNEEHGVFNTEDPVIIFDDFTTAFQFVDFRFKAKSSAMKILKCASKEINIRYVYEAMKRIKFPIGEHKRYWISEYQREKIPYPNHKEQQKIADFLSSLDRKIDLIGEELEKAQQFKKGLLQQMFI